MNGTKRMQKRVAAATMMMFSACGTPKKASPAAIGPGSGIHAADHLRHAKAVDQFAGGGVADIDQQDQGLERGVHRRLGGDHQAVAHEVIDALGEEVPDPLEEGDDLIEKTGEPFHRVSPSAE